MRSSFVLILLAVGLLASCTTTPPAAPPPPAEVSTATASTPQDSAETESSTPTDTQADNSAPASPNTEAALCNDKRPGQEIPLDQHYAATLLGEGRVPISDDLGADPGSSYGIGGESVIALSFGYDDACQEWLKLKWPESGFIGWLPRGKAVELVY